MELRGNVQDINGFFLKEHFYDCELIILCVTSDPRVLVVGTKIKEWLISTYSILHRLTLAMVEQVTLT